MSRRAGARRPRLEARLRPPSCRTLRRPAAQAPCHSTGRPTRSTSGRPGRRGPARHPALAGRLPRLTWRSSSSAQLPPYWGSRRLPARQRSRAAPSRRQRPCPPLRGGGARRAHQPSSSPIRTMPLRRRWQQPRGLRGRGLGRNRRRRSYPPLTSGERPVSAAWPWGLPPGTRTRTANLTRRIRRWCLRTTKAAVTPPSRRPSGTSRPSMSRASSCLRPRCSSGSRSRLSSPSYGWRTSGRTYRPPRLPRCPALRRPRSAQGAAGASRRRGR